MRQKKKEEKRLPGRNARIIYFLFAFSHHLLNADQLQAREAWVSHVIHNVNFMLSKTVWQVLPHFTSGNQSEGQHVRERDNLMVWQLTRERNVVRLCQEASVCHGLIFIYLPNSTAQIKCHISFTLLPFGDAQNLFKSEVWSCSVWLKLTERGLDDTRHSLVRGQLKIRALTHSHSHQENEFK